MGNSDFSWKLADHPKLPKGKTVAVVVLDGWGEANPDKYNCIHVAETPTMDSAQAVDHRPIYGAPDKWRLVRAHGTAVGLPTEDDMGNSEVGHNALGAGSIFAQGAKLVDLALASGKIYDGEGFKYIKECFDQGTLHLTGLLSDGGVRSRLDQLQLLLKGSSEHGAKRIRVHVLTDGRDVLDGSSNDWGVVKRAWDAQVLGEAPHKFRSAAEAVKKLREDPKTNDQYLPPFVIVDESGKAVGPMVDGDAVVTFNFQADRMVMVAKALEYEDFDKFDRVRFPKIRYAGMLQYDGELKLPSRMKAVEIAEKARDAILSRKFDQVHVNLPNGDMVGHTGDIEATIVGCKAADEAVKVSIAVGGSGLALGVRFLKDVLNGGLANVAATIMNLHQTTVR
ncbi:2,3-bisphosphoglycerate-independent phosphoglycerate mutase [Musa troglodytarum]|uniref:phosphoglycerate mutase (2,3-diphosphoglycerate-independent) n=1 Tax=Musa troglodytarum TaxID=320322 RepID=A0A9E7JUV4_9LILI|nr:2,3-bisphosphoglycerate-independent phosphoglycerate mutase [Musa troglodytarum]